MIHRVMIWYFDLLPIRPLWFYHFGSSKTLQPSYQIPVVKPCSHFISLIHCNINFALGFHNKSTNLIVVDAMLPMMAKNADIWSLKLVSIQAFHLSPGKSRKLKQILLLKIICSFGITQFSSRTSKFWQAVIQNFTVRSKKVF